MTKVWKFLLWFILEKHKNRGKCTSASQNFLSGIVIDFFIFYFRVKILKTSNTTHCRISGAQSSSSFIYLKIHSESVHSSEPVRLRDDCLHCKHVCVWLWVSQTVRNVSDSALVVHIVPALADWGHMFSSLRREWGVPLTTVGASPLCTFASWPLSSGAAT